MTTDAAAPTQLTPVLTERQQAVFSFVQQYIANKGYPPSRHEIKNAMGLKSANSAQEALVRLQTKGLIELDHKIPRGIRVLK